MSKELETLPRLDRRTGVRFGVLAFACTLSMVSYLDRVCISKAIPDIVKALNLNSEADLGWAFFAFALSYAAFEIPSGWLGDVYGPRNVIIRIVLWWSFFTALTGLVGMTYFGIFFGLPLLIVIRFLFGMGEAGTYPNITRALHNWFPFSERGAAQGAVWMSGRLMGGLTPMLWLLLTSVLGLQWRQLFWIFAVVGILWSGLFFMFFRNRPEEHPRVSDEELELIRSGNNDSEAGHAGVPWGRIVTSSNVWALCLMYFCASFGWYFNISYLSTYLVKQLGAERDSPLTAVFQGGPLWLGACACLVGGILTDWFIRRTGNRKWGRRLFGVVGHGLSAVCYFASAFCTTPFTFFLAISFGAFFSDLTMGAAWSVCQDIGRRYAGIVAGFMNTVGNLGGAAAQWVTKVALGHFLASFAAGQGVEIAELTDAQKVIGIQPGYQVSLIFFGVAYVIAVVLWLRIDSTEPVVPDVVVPHAE
jgi:ACS family glucarate transporter-like MFS transporter